MDGEDGSFFKIPYGYISDFLPSFGTTESQNKYPEHYVQNLCLKFSERTYHDYFTLSSDDEGQGNYNYSKPCLKTRLSTW